MNVIYEHVPVKPRLPFLVIQEDERSYYKVLLRGRYLFVSHGSGKLERENGELDVPFVGVGRHPIGDFVYDTRDDAAAAFARFRADPDAALRLVSAGRKP